MLIPYLTPGSLMRQNPQYVGVWRYQNRDLAFRLIERTTLPHVLRDLAESAGTSPALTWYDDDTRYLHLDYAELIGQVWAMAGWLFASCGVRHGDRVVLISSNCPDAFVAHLATMSLGVITVPVNNTESERVLGFIIEQVSPRVVL